MNKYRELSEKLTPEQNRLWAIACAELVLPIFEEKYPNDDRPRKAIEAAKDKSPDADVWAAAVWAADAAAYAAVWGADAVWASACAADAAATYAADADYTAYASAYYAEKAGADTAEILQLGEKHRYE